LSKKIINKTTNAIILAAGLGSRLNPLTDEMPKCLTEVNGIPILEHILNILNINEIEKVTIVIGYLGDIIKKKFGSKFNNIQIYYIWNEKYNETNSMYSLLLAKDTLIKGALILEGDTFCEEKIISSTLNCDNNKSLWVGDNFTSEHEGSMSTTDKNGQIQKVEIVRGKLAEYKKNFYKSTGILKITPEYGKELIEWLEIEKNTNIYFDLVIANHLDTPIYVYDVTGLKWADLDNLFELKKVEKLFVPRKYVIVIIDGAGDNLLPELDNKTPLEIAKTPYLDSLAKNGKTGLMRTVYPSLAVGGIVANLGILGYNPTRYYPNGRASFEALAQGIFLQENDIAFRCNLVSIKDGILTDFTSNNINEVTGRKVIEYLSGILPAYILLYPGQGYRNILVCRHLMSINANEIQTQEPHSNIGKSIEDLLPYGKTTLSEKLAEQLRALSLRSIELLKKYNISKKTCANMLFFWSPSSVPNIPSFRSKYNIDGAIVAGSDFIRGIGIASHLTSEKILGTTGDSDTNLKNKTEIATNLLRFNDLVYIHINAPDEESHRKSIDGKVKILEKIDKEVINPLFKSLNNSYGDEFRIAVLPDHYTLVENGKHSNNLVPYLIYGKGIKKNDVQVFSEPAVEAKARTIIKSYEFMDFLLK